MVCVEIFLPSVKFETCFGFCLRHSSKKSKLCIGCSLLAQAQKVFDEKAIGMRKDEFFAKFKAEAVQEYTRMRQTVEKHASENCTRVLEELWTKLSNMQYDESEAFSAALKGLFVEYYQRTPNVPAKMDVLQKFLSGSFADVISKYVKTHETAAKSALAKQKQMKDEFSEKSAQMQSEQGHIQHHMQQIDSHCRNLEEEISRATLAVRQLEAENNELTRRVHDEGNRIKSEHESLTRAREQLQREVGDRTTDLTEIDQGLLALLQESRALQNRLVSQFGAQ
eukprot:TRINITY_DN1575_c0_g1_i5.p1 TRINITY_DN1575_c0_g1~~TRINITY_DN1575_c0_g1_i5.p1  ORF type:complete len:281 (-),score=71.40 TRINITY_DN1575_c0_g1_i5:212-1054(-)